MEFKKNDTIVIDITDMGAGGEGIGRADGFAFFVKDAVIGDRIEARITKLKKQYGYARMEKALTPSSFRVEPVCEFHRQCGGCQIQAVSYEKQLEFKQRKVRNDLLRLGGFSEELLDRVMEPIVGMEEPFHYRNKAQFPIGTDKEGKIVCGFYAGRTHQIIANTDCALGVSENREILEAVLSYMKECRVSAYDERTGKGLVRHVLIRKGFSSGELMICLVVNSRWKQEKTLPAMERLVEKLIKIKNMTSVSLNCNTDNTNVILGKETHTLWGSDCIEDSLRLLRIKDGQFEETRQSVSYKISPGSFYQVNPVQTERLYSLALDYAGLAGTETVWDLYCGIGAISLFLARRARWVYGVEIFPQAVLDARENARRNGIKNAEFFTGRAEEVLPEKYEKEGIRADIIVVDPPRKGCDKKCLETILQMRPEKVVYISCDPATLARDLKLLWEGGYAPERIRPVDLFPQTVHVEVVCLLSKLRDAKQHIEVALEMDELDLTAAESKATYEEIKEYVLKQTGLKVSSLYIAQVKRECGIIERENYNKAKSENVKQPKCPPEKEKAIRKALEHFGMI